MTQQTDAGRSDDAWFSSSATHYHGLTDTAATLSNALSVSAKPLEFHEFVLPLPMQGVAIIVRRVQAEPWMDLDDKLYAAQPALDVDPKQLDLDAYRDAWMGVLSLADPFKRLVAFNIQEEGSPTQYFAKATLCSLLTQLPNSNAWFKATLHADAYLTIEQHGSMLLLPAPGAGFLDLHTGKKRSVNTGLPQPVLLTISTASQTLEALEIEPDMLLLSLPAVWPDDTPTLRCDGIALLQYYVSTDKKKVQLREKPGEEVLGFVHGGQIAADVLQTLPEQLFALIEKHCKLVSIELFIYETQIDRNSERSGFLDEALPGWALPPPPLLFNWTQAPSDAWDDWLPDTVGFEYTTRPTATDKWTSPGYLLADRSLAIGETLHVFAQDIHTGAVLEQISLTADKQNHLRNQWPIELAKRINAADTRFDTPICIGNEVDGAFGIATDTPDSTAFAAMNDEARNAVSRLWSHGSDIRVTTTAPFMANLVCALLLPATDLLPGTRLCVQVRDATTQRLLENHFFTPADFLLEAHQWAPALCHFLNTQSAWLRAGQLFGSSTWIVPSANNNGIWIPQESDLSVTVQPLHWQKHSRFEANKPFEAGQRMVLHVHDPFTGEPMPGSPFVFRPSVKECPKTAWPAALAKALMASPLADYIRLGNASEPGAGVLDNSATEGVWWTPNLVLRIWFDDPQGAVLDWTCVMNEDDEPLLLSSLYQAPYGALEIILRDRKTQMPWRYLSYTPELNGQAHDLESWTRGLYNCLRAQDPISVAVAANRPEVNAWDLPGSPFEQWKLWVPRQGEMDTVLLSVPTKPLKYTGQWPPVEANVNPLKVDSEYLIFAKNSTTGQMLPGSPFKFKGTTTNREPAKWVDELTKALKTVAWGHSISIDIPDTDLPYTARFQNQSSDTVVTFDPAMLSSHWEEAISEYGGPSVCPADWYKSPSTALVVIPTAARQPSRCTYVPATDGSVTDKRSWLRGLYNVLFCYSLKSELDFIAVSPALVGHSTWDFSDPQSCKIWLRQGSGMLKFEYFQHSKTTTTPASISTPDFSDPHPVHDRLLKQGSFLAGNIEWFNCQDKENWIAPLRTPYLGSDFKASKAVVRDLVGLVRTNDRVGNMDDDAKLVNLREAMTIGGLHERLQPLPKLHSDIRLRDALELLDEGMLQGALHYRLSLDDGQQLSEPYRWLLGFDYSVRALIPLHCSGRELSVAVVTTESQTVFRLRLLPGVFAAGVRLLSCHVEPDSENALSIGLHLPDYPAWPSLGATGPSPLAWADFTTDQALSQGGRQVCIETPLRGRAFIPEDSLCADYSNTVQSEVYDVSGVVENGVDPRTGLFHAHYPIATLQGVEGLGPVVELNIHYSARRANEGALGDGWAFRFSSFDNRLRMLTLGTGQTIQLTTDDVYQLCTQPDKVLDKGFCRLSHGVADGKLYGKWTCLSSLTITYLSHRVEVLAKPAVHDGKEAGEKYRETVWAKLSSIFNNLNHWIYNEEITDKQKDDFKSSRDNLEKEFWEFSRRAFILTTNSITSPQGGVLELTWEGWQGHVRLLNVQSGTTCLLRAVHEQPIRSGRYSSTFHVWPGTHEAYQVTLTIDDCLLRTLVRKADEQSSAIQQVQYGYQPDKALDRVLCSVREEDGSLEVVSYEPQVPRRKQLRRRHDSLELPEEDWETGTSGDPGTEEPDPEDLQLWPNEAPTTPLPRVARHTLVPGAGQATISHRWRWADYDPRDGNGRFTSTETLEVNAPNGAPFTQRIWGVKNGMELPLAIVEETPGSIRRTTTNTYPDTTEATDSQIKSLLLSQPIATDITYEDVSEQANEEPQS